VKQGLGTLAPADLIRVERSLVVFLGVGRDPLLYYYLPAATAEPIMLHSGWALSGRR
jgi:hypothetical protein